MKRTEILNKIAILAAISALSVSMTGCGNKAENKSQVTESSSTTASTTPPAAGESASEATAAPKTDEQIQEELDNFAKDADKDADMDKIEGTKLKSEGDGKADFSGYDVKIKSAVKSQTASGAGVIVVEFSFKNNTSETTKFSSVIKALAFQNDQSLPYAVDYEAEGYNVLTVAQDVAYKEEITVQRAFKLTSDTDDVTVQVQLADTIGGSEPTVKLFKLTD